MLAYPIELAPDDNDTLLVTCPLLPMVITFGETEAEARAHAADAIETALASMIDDREDIPIPPPDPRAVRLPLLTSLKVQLYCALRTSGITRAELARPLNWKRELVDRLFPLDHRSRLEQIETAFRALAQEIELTTTRAA